MKARLKPGETIGDRVIKVDHAGEHGAICIYRAQLWVAQWRAPGLVSEIEHFLEHETQHRTIFQRELQRRGRERCRSYHLCGVGGLALGVVTGLIGHQGISATTYAIEQVVLRHLEEQHRALENIDPAAARAIATIIADERDHHDTAEKQLDHSNPWVRLIVPVVTASTEAVIWLGMKL